MTTIFSFLAIKLSASCCKLSLQLNSISRMMDQKALYFPASSSIFHLFVLLQVRAPHSEQLRKLENIALVKKTMSARDGPADKIYERKDSRTSASLAMRPKRRQPEACPKQNITSENEGQGSDFQQPDKRGRSHQGVQLIQPWP